MTNQLVTKIVTFIASIFLRYFVFHRNRRASFTNSAALRDNPGPFHLRGPLDDLPGRRPALVVTCRYWGRDRALGRVPVASSGRPWRRAMSPGSRALWRARKPCDRQEWAPICQKFGQIIRKVKSSSVNFHIIWHIIFHVIWHLRQRCVNF